MQYDQSVPAHLRDPSLIEGQEAFTDGIGGARGPHITMKNGFFFLVGGDGTRTQIGNQFDFVLVDANPGISKLYYEGAFVEGSAEPPTCFSNDGKYPDRSIAEPPGDNCSSCPMNAWGSAVTTAGKQAKACSDRKRLAVLYPYTIPNVASIMGPLFELSVSPSNLRPWNEHLSQLYGRGIPPRGIVHRVTPNPAAQGGMLFQAALAQGGVGIWFIPEQVVPVIQRARASDECRKALGMVGEQRQLAAPAAQQQLPPAQSVMGPTAQPQVQVGQPASTAAFQGTTQGGAAFAPQPGSPPAGAATTASTDAGRRPRRTKAEMEAVRAATANPPATSATDPFAQSTTAGAVPQATAFAPPPAGNGAFNIVTNPAAVSPELDAMLVGIMGQPTS